MINVNNAGAGRRQAYSEVECDLEDMFKGPITCRLIGSTVRAVRVGDLAAIWAPIRQARFPRNLA